MCNANSLIRPCLLQICRPPTRNEGPTSNGKERERRGAKGRESREEKEGERREGRKGRGKEGKGREGKGKGKKGLPRFEINSGFWKGASAEARRHEH